MTKILAIEDEPQIRSNIEEILQLADFQVILAKDGSEGVDLARENLPDLIVCDVMMPKLDGYGVLKALKKETATKNIPLVFLTAKADKSDFREGMGLGADDYLTKPFTPEELLEAIATRLVKKADVELQNQLQMEELRNNITHSLPHELYTPLNGIISSAAYMEEYADLLDGEEIEEMARNIKISSERLYRLTQNFLLYADLQLSLTDPEKAESLRKKNDKCFIEEGVTVVAVNQAKRGKREADLQLDLQDAMVAISPQNLGKLVEELVDNAFKFSSAGEPVKLVGTAKSETFDLKIVDRGRGMTPEQIAKIGSYMQFNRQTYEQQGPGLGLAICKRLLELHGGELKIERKVGETIVSVILPTILSI